MSSTSLHADHVGGAIIALSQPENSAIPLENSRFSNAHTPDNIGGLDNTQVMVEMALLRAFEYLHSSGVVINKAVSLTVLRLIDELLSADHPDLLALMMQKLPELITLPHPQLPPSFPLIQRASIGYDQR